MRKLVLKMSISADGFVCGPNGEIDWLIRTMDKSALEWIENTLWQAGVHIMGRKTFHDMAAEGQESVFHQFEEIAIPTILKYNGRLLLRVRPTENAFIEQHIDKPYEIHLVEFDTEQDFENFKQDEERKKFLHLKDQSIKSVLLIKGTKL